MSIIFGMNANGKVKIYPYGITNGNRVIPAESEEYANNILKRKPYNDGAYTVIQSDEPSEKLLETLKGVRFDTYEDAELFINGGGYEESIAVRVADLELVMAEMIGGEE